MAEGRIRKGDSKEVAFYLWGLVEGFIFIHRRGYMDSWSVDLYGMAEKAVRPSTAVCPALREWILDSRAGIGGDIY
ncbi:MAG: hypothetical protein SWK76_08065 [Actinomycetota bacterium]|nr:hypothetical protein [Actinomycetota bacterium]